MSNSKFLSSHVSHQVNLFFLADKQTKNNESKIIEDNIAPSIKRLSPILESVKNFSTPFDHLHSLQYATFLYILSNQIFLQEGACEICDKIFFLNKAISSIDLHYQVKMPKIFFISHGLGSVIGNAKYGNNFIFFQNVTIGRLGNMSPKIGSDVVMYPGSVITGNSIIGNNVVISANTTVHNCNIPNNSIVFPGKKAPKIKPLQKKYTELYLSN